MTMRNLRRWGALALAMTMIWGAGACGSPDGQASQTPSRSPSARESTSTDASVTPGTEQYRDSRSTTCCIRQPRVTFISI